MTNPAPSSTTPEAACEALRAILGQVSATRTERAYIDGVIAGLGFALAPDSGEPSTTQPDCP